MLKKIAVVVGIVIILGLVAAIFQKYFTPTEQSNDIVGYWNLTEFSNEDASDQIPQDIKGATIIFEDTGRVGGIAFCNNYSGTYETDSSNITFGPMATTKKACEETVMELESKYHAALENTTNYKVENNMLYLIDEAGIYILSFNLRLEVLIEDTDWNIIGYNNGNGGVTTVIIETEITANFSNDNVGGTSGCNSYNASYSLEEENNIEIGIPSVTLVACGEDIFEQEQQYLTALQNATKYEMTFDGLELRDNNGNLQVVMSSE